MAELKGAALHWYTCVSGRRFWKIWVMVSENDVMMSWLRLLSTPECISLSHSIYIKCFSTLRCCGWAQGYSLTLIHLCRWAQILGILGQAEWKWCNDVMVVAVKHPRVHLTFTFYIYKVFQHLKMLWLSSRVQPYTDTPVSVGPVFGKFGSGWVKVM